MPTRINGQDTVGIFYPHGPYALTVGEPIQFKGNVQNRVVVRQLSERLWQRIAWLSQEGAARLNTRQTSALPTALV